MVIREKIVELNYFVDIKDVLMLEWKLKCLLCQGRGFFFVVIGEEKLWKLLRLMKIRFEQKGFLE